MAVVLLAITAVSAVPFAFAQYGPTLEMLEECADSGISADRCSEEAILKTRCLGGPNSPCNPSTEVEMDANLYPIYAGIAAAFAGGVLYVRRTKDSRKTRQSH
jgi:hypothetical protein